MKPNLLAVLSLVAILGLSIATPAALAGDGANAYQNDRAVVKLARGASIDEINSDYDTSVVAAIPSRSMFLLQLPENSDEEGFEMVLEQDPRIEWADLNFQDAVPGGSTQSFFFNVASDLFLTQYAFDRVNFGSGQSSTGQGVVVALLDTGLDVNHPALLGHIAPSSYNFVDGISSVADLPNGIDDDDDGFIDEMVGHGTFIAGLVAHIAPDALILPVKVLDSDGSGDSFQVAQGIYYAMEHGATVINLSLGTTNESQVLATAVADAHDAGVTVLAAAGNENQLMPLVYPAADPHVIGVASTTSADLKSDFSNYGTYVTISAPGTDIVSLYPDNQYAQCSGTSAATALVSGTAVLLKSANLQLTPDQIRFQLQQSADGIDNLNPPYAGLLGAGRLNVGAAVADAMPVIGDLNGDRHVNVADLLILIGAWAQPSSPADLNGDGTVNVGDLLMLLAHWG